MTRCGHPDAAVLWSGLVLDSCGNAYVEGTCSRCHAPVVVRDRRTRRRPTHAKIDPKEYRR